MNQQAIIGVWRDMINHLWAFFLLYKAIFIFALQTFVLWDTHMRAKPFLIGNCKSPLGCWWSRNPSNLTTLNFPFIAISLNNPTLWAPRLPLFLLSLALLLFLQIFTYFHFIGLLSLFSVGRWREEPISISGAYHIFLWPRVQDKGHYPSGLSFFALGL